MIMHRIMENIRTRPHDEWKLTELEKENSARLGIKIGQKSDAILKHLGRDFG